MYMRVVEFIQLVYGFKYLKVGHINIFFLSKLVENYGIYFPLQIQFNLIILNPISW